MTPHIDLLPLGPQTYAAFVTDGSATTMHRVVVSREFLTGNGLQGADEESVAHQAIACLLADRPGVPLPDVVQLASPTVGGEQLVVDLRERLLL